MGSEAGLYDEADKPSDTHTQINIARSIRDFAVGTNTASASDKADENERVVQRSDRGSVSSERGSTTSAERCEKRPRSPVRGARRSDVGSEARPMTNPGVERIVRRSTDKKVRRSNDIPIRRSNDIQARRSTDGKLRRSIDKKVRRSTDMKYQPRANGHETPHSNATEDDGAETDETVSWRSGADVGNRNALLSWAIRHHQRDLIHTIEKKPQAAFLESITGLKRHHEPKDSERQGSSLWKRPEEDRSFRVSLAEMQRMRMRKLQCKLVGHAVAIYSQEEEPEDWESDLEAYIKALQDYEYMVEHSQSLKDPFLVSGERFIDDYVIRKALGDLKHGDIGRTIHIPGPWHEDSQPIGGTRNETVGQSWIRGFKERLMMATLGGFFLIGPMWLMVLKSGLYNTLIETTVFVTAFGLFMAWFVKEPQEVMSNTAAYAAVLFVFVGLQTSA